MSRLKKRRIAHHKEAELEVTPFMNMMMLLVCALLASVVFTKITVIDLDFPAGNGTGAVDPDQVHLEVIVRDDQTRRCRRSRRLDQDAAAWSTASRTSRVCRS